MIRLGWALVGCGFLLQLLIPVNWIDLGEGSLFGIPAPLLGIFFASIAMVIGLYLVYAGWYKSRALRIGKLDRPR